MTPDEKLAYNRGCTALVEAFDILGNVVVTGWQPRVLLNDVHNLLQEAAEQFFDIGPNYLSVRLRQQMTGMCRMAARDQSRACHNKGI